MSQPTQPIDPFTLRGHLLDNLSEKCSLDEMADFCFRLGVDFDNLSGDTKAAKSRQLIIHLERHNRITELISLGIQRRPDLVWEMPKANSVPSSSPYAKAIPNMPQPVDFIKGLPSDDRLVLEQPFPLELIRVPAGEFLMGSSDADAAALGHEKPQHRVHVDTYWISRHEITVAQFTAFVNATGHVTMAEKRGGGLEPYTIPTGEDFRLLKDADWRRPYGPGSNISDKQGHPVTQVVGMMRWLSANG